MSRYTVHVEEDVGEYHVPFVYGSYDDPLEANHALFMAELSYPKGAVWMTDEKKNVIPREDLIPPDKPDLSYIPPALDEYQEDGIDPLLDARAEANREQCPHNWVQYGDGLVYCLYHCGIRSHKPYPGEVDDNGVAFR